MTNETPDDEDEPKSRPSFVTPPHLQRSMSEAFRVHSQVNRAFKPRILGQYDGFRKQMNAATGLTRVWEQVRPHYAAAEQMRGITGLSGAHVRGQFSVPVTRELFATHRRLASDRLLDSVRWQLPRISLTPAFGPRFSQVLREVSRTVRRLLPDNLVDLIDKDWDTVARIVKSDRIGLAWTVRTDIIQSLLDAADANERAQVLLDHRGETLFDCLDCLQDTQHDTVRELAAFTRKAVLAAQAGHHESAQALATNVLDTALREKPPAGFTRSSVLKFLKNPVSKEYTLRLWRLMISGCGIPPSYEGYEYHSRSPRFSRHGTAHCVNADLYQELNALKAITLATSWLRLLSEEATEDDARKAA